MPSLIEELLSSELAAWLEDHRPAAIPSDIPIHVANRDELRTRPCIVVATSEAKSIPGLRHTARLKLDIHLFSQVDDTPNEDHSGWAAELAALLADVATIQAALNTDTFCLHDLLARETATTPDEQRGRETVLSYEAVVSAV